MVNHSHCKAQDTQTNLYFQETVQESNSAQSNYIFNTCVNIEEKHLSLADNSLYNKRSLTLEIQW